MKTSRQSVFLFVGIGLMLFFSTFSYTILRDVQSVLIVQKLGVAVIPTLKLLVVPVTLVLGLLILPLCRRGKIGRGFLIFFPLNMIILGVLAWLYQSEYSWIYGGFDIWSNVSMTLSLIFIWGYANQEFTFKKAAIQYPILALIFSSAATLLAGDFIKCLSKWDFLFPKVYLFALLMGVGASFLILVLYLLLNSLRLNEEEQGSSVSWGYWVALGLLLFAVKFSAMFPKVAFKMKVYRLYPDSVSYTQFMGKYALISSSIMMGLSLVGIGLGVILYYRGARAFFKVAGYVLLGVTTFGFMTFFIQTIMITTFSSALFSGLIGVFISLRELPFFGIKKESRFTAKIILDLIFCSLTAIFGTTVMQFALVFMGDSNQSLDVLLFFIAIVVGFVSLCRIQRDMKKGIPRIENCR